MSRRRAPASGERTLAQASGLTPLSTIRAGSRLDEVGAGPARATSTRLGWPTDPGPSSNGPRPRAGCFHSGLMPSCGGATSESSGPATAG